MMPFSLRQILTATATAALFGNLHAAETPVAKAPAEAARYELKTKSAFTLSADRRAPFWPIGWVKHAPQARTEVVQAPKPKLDASAFSVTSILLGNPSLAVVNGRAYSEGEFVRAPKGSPPVKVRVQQIGDGSVTLCYEQQIFAVALKRPELAARKAEEFLEPEN